MWPYHEVVEVHRLDFVSKQIDGRMAHLRVGRRIRIDIDRALRCHRPFACINALIELADERKPIGEQALAE